MNSDVAENIFARLSDEKTSVFIVKLLGDPFFRPRSGEAEFFYLGNVGNVLGGHGLDFGSQGVEKP